MNKTSFARHLLACFSVPVLLSGCDGGFLGATDDKEPLQGERISVMALQQDLTTDAGIANLEVVLPPARENAAWAQPGGNAAHRMGHLALGKADDALWSISIGAGADSDTALMAPPVVDSGRIFTIATDGVLRAFEAATGQAVWAAETALPDEEELIYGGSISTGGGAVYVGTGYGAVIAFDQGSGALLWRTTVSAPVRSAPTHDNGRLFLTTIDNQAVALSATTGERLWTHAGITENAALLGRASPAVAGDIVIVPYSSGEVFALRAETGRQFWSDGLAVLRSADAVSSLGDISGHPVIDNDLVVAISHSGKISALDLRSGLRIWEHLIGGVNMPWVAGEFVFVISNNGEVVCLTRRDGRVRWLTRLPEFEDPEDREGRIQYAGPVLAGGTLYLVSSLGELYRVSPLDGKVISSVDISGTVFLPPIVAGGILYVLNDGGQLQAWR